jgi:tRNA1(Val) A37 N6-methylase TrmN6
LNGLEERITVVQEDWRFYRPGRKFDLVFSNPPYIRKAAGFLSRTVEKSIAKHELHGEIKNVMQLAAELLKAEGRACFIYPEKRRKDFVEAAEGAGLYPGLLRSVHPREGEPANLFLSELRFQSEPPTILPPLLLYGSDGAYTKEAEDIFSGRGGRGVGPR